MNLFDTKKNVFTIYLTSDVMLFQNILEDAILGLRPNWIDTVVTWMV